jgi:hypothetical protein
MKIENDRGTVLEPYVKIRSVHKGGPMSSTPFWTTIWISLKRSVLGIK